MSAPKITLARKSGADALAKRLAGLTRIEALVGIPTAQSRQRKATLTALAGSIKNKKKKARLEKAAQEDVTNAELLYLFSKGSPARHIPPRPVLEPAVQADGNRQAIGHELAEASKAALAGDKQKQLQRMKRAGIAGQNAARGWFTDSRNGWDPNAPSTIAAKGSDRPGIDTGAMRQAITYVVSEE